MSQTFDVTLLGPAGRGRTGRGSDPTRLSLDVELPDGRHYRWGDNEADTGRLPADLEFTTKVPGGFDQLTTSVLRDRRVREDEQLATRVRAIGPGEQVAWEGMISALPRAGRQLSGQAVGFSALLTFDPSFMQIYADANPAAWGQMPVAEQIRIGQAGNDTQTFGWAGSGGQLACVLPATALPAQTEHSAWYIAPAGCKVAKVRYRGARTTWPAGWVAPAVATHDLDHYNAGSSASTALTLDDTVRLATITTPRRYAAIGAWSNGNAVTPAAGTQERYTLLVVYGDHRLQIQDDGSILGHLIVDDIVARCAPSLRRRIDPVTFGVPHMSFAQPMNGADALQAVNAYYAWEWAVWENRTFHWREPQPLVTWIARRDENADGSLEGDQLEHVYNGVVVYYTDLLSGRQRVVGPPGCANADVTSSLLEDTTTTNPVNRAGLGRKWDRLDLSMITTDEGAARIGRVWLEQKRQATRRGDITITGVATRTDGLEQPAWMVRAGDYITFSDQPGEPARRIITTRYQQSTRTVSASVDNTPQKAEAILDRLAVAQVGKA